MAVTSKPFDEERSKRGALHILFLLAFGLAGGLTFYWACVREGAPIGLTPAGV
jgi:hypothetical protein